MNGLLAIGAGIAALVGLVPLQRQQLSTVSLSDFLQLFFLNNQILGQMDILI